MYQRLEELGAILQFFKQPANTTNGPKVLVIQDYLDGNGVTKLTQNEIISKALIKMLMVKPFWGMLLSSVSITLAEVPGMDTAWTDGHDVFFSPKFFGLLTLNEFNFILAHEVWHMANLHIPRLGAKDPKIWNIASDHWINLTLEDECGPDTGMEVPDMKRIFNDPNSGLCMDRKYANMASDVIYADIMRDITENPDKDPGANNGLGGDLDYAGFDAKEGTQEEKAKKLGEEWKNRIAGAMDSAKKAGKMPGGLAREINKLLQPEVDWQSMLAQYISFNPQDYEFTQPDRRFTEWPFVVPDMIGEKLECAITIDTSGSISAKMIQKFISEAYAIINSFGHVAGTLIGHDHGVHDWHEFDSNNPPPTTLKGGGGTDFFCVFNECKDKDYKPDVMIWFTDLYASIPPAPDFPVLYVIVNSSEKPPEWAADHIYINVPYH